VVAGFWVEGMPKTIVEGEGRVRDWVCKNTHVLIFFPPSSSKPLNKSNGVSKWSTGEPFA
jgi:hypothetical protein